MNPSQAIRAARRAAQVLETDYQYESEPDRQRSPRKFKRLRHWLKVQNRARKALKGTK